MFFRLTVKRMNYTTLSQWHLRSQIHDPLVQELFHIITETLHYSIFRKISDERCKLKTKVPAPAKDWNTRTITLNFVHQGKQLMVWNESSKAKMTSFAAATLRRISPALVDTRVYSCFSVLPRTCSVGGNVKSFGCSWSIDSISRQPLPLSFLVFTCISAQFISVPWSIGSSGGH